MKIAIEAETPARLVPQEAEKLFRQYLAGGLCRHDRLLRHCPECSAKKEAKIADPSAEKCCDTGSQG